MAYAHFTFEVYIRAKVGLSAEVRLLQCVGQDGARIPEVEAYARVCVLAG